MSTNVEKAIQEEVHRLTEEQQQEVMAFVETLKLRPNNQNGGRFSFIGITHSDSESAEDKELFLAAAALLADYQSDRELTAFTSLDGEDVRHA